MIHNRRAIATTARHHGHGWLEGIEIAIGQEWLNVGRETGRLEVFEKLIV
jgi:hypothetical protein